jgi:iron-sulfur cluster assembly accessory protein
LLLVCLFLVASSWRAEIGAFSPHVCLKIVKPALPDFIQSVSKLGRKLAETGELLPGMPNLRNLYYNGLVFSSIHFSRRNAMATTTTPEVGTPAKTPVTLTPTAVSKVREIMAQQNPVPAGLRIGVVGGGCSGFSYSMSFENAPGMMDKVLNFDGLKVYVDATSAMYLDGCTVDFVETLEASGFKFENPNVKSTCGCGSSFNV